MSLVEGHLTGARYRNLAELVAGAQSHPRHANRKPGRQMAMWIDITMSDGTSIYVRASGGYAPDVMNDLQNRARTLMAHAASIGLEVRQEENRQDAADMAADDEEVSE